MEKTTSSLCDMTLRLSLLEVTNRKLQKHATFCSCARSLLHISTLCPVHFENLEVLPNEVCTTTRALPLVA